jgi:hypothetical protein
MDLLMSRLSKRLAWRTVFCCVLAWALNFGWLGGSVQSQGVEDLVRYYKAGFDNIKTVSGKGYFLLPRDQSAIGDWREIDGWRVHRESDFRFSKDGNLSWEHQKTHYIDDDENAFRHGESIHAHDGERSYARNEVEMLGMISQSQGGDQMPPPTNPFAAFGSALVPNRKGRLLNLWDIIGHSKVSLGELEDQFVLDSPHEMEWNRVVVTLDDEMGYLPSKIDFLQTSNTPDEWILKERREILSAKKVGRLFVPTECVFYHRSKKSNGELVLEPQGKLYIVPDELAVNETFTAKDFQIEFPSNYEYHDFIVGKTFNKKSPPQVATKENDKGSSKRLILIVVNLVIIAIVAFFYFRKKRSATVSMLLAVMLPISGCGISQPVSVLEVDGSAQHRVTLAAGHEITHTETFVLLNSGASRVDFRDIIASCGCTSAEVAPTSIAPGEKAVVTAIVVREHFVSPRLISLTVPHVCGDAQEEQLVLNLLLTPESDWASSRTYLQVSGIAGYETKISLPLKIASQASSGVFRIEEDGVFSLDSVEQADDRTRTLRISARLPDAPGKTMEELLVYAEDGLKPSQWQLTVEFSGVPPANWEPSSVILSSESESLVEAELVLNEGIKLTRIDASEGFTAKMMRSAHGTSKVLVTISALAPKRFPTGVITAIVSDDQLEWPVELIAVCR